MIEVRDLTFSYGKGKQILHGLNFSVKDGEIFGFLGPNGSGKSTTQKILTGILKNHGGAVSLFGQDIQNVQTQEFFRKIGVLFEFPYLYTNLSALDNLHYFASFYPAEHTRNAEELLDELEFKKDFLKKRCASASAWQGRLSAIPNFCFWMNLQAVLTLLEQSSFVKSLKRNDKKVQRSFLPRIICWMPICFVIG